MINRDDVVPWSIEPMYARLAMCVTVERRVNDKGDEWLSDAKYYQQRLRRKKYLIVSTSRIENEVLKPPKKKAKLHIKLLVRGNVLKR
jgi:hypothetical protein